jgi:serine/threonine protein kinase
MDRAYTILSFLGAGTFNCAHRVQANGDEKESVLRLSRIQDMGYSGAFLVFVPRTEDYRKGKREREPETPTLTEDQTFDEYDLLVLRGTAIVHLLNQILSELGPSMLREVSPFLIANQPELKQIVTNPDLLCVNIRPERAGFFVLQNIELLETGKPKLEERPGAVFLFSLLWFFAAARTQFNFKHHDLKPANLLIRFSADGFDPSPIDYLYVFKETHRFLLTSEYVPVVIDYDFASVQTTRNEADVHRLGTMVYAPPDALLLDLFYESPFQTPFPLDHETRVAVSENYDLWAVAIIFLEYVRALNPVTLLRVECNDWAERTMALLLIDSRRDNQAMFLWKQNVARNRSYNVELLSAYCMARQVALVMDADGFYLRDRIPESRHFEDISLLHTLAGTQLVRRMERLRTLYPAVFNVVRRLLMTNPRERSYGNRPWEFLKEDLFQQFRTFDDARARDVPQERRFATGDKSTNQTRMEPQKDTRSVFLQEEIE